ncbi:glycosyltransferase [Azospirillum sp.]|uniref:glycosyltransferase n=1 Tax=Azospirillum sp. TaxID=34012 RepID=UPI002D6C5D37|nr:glycosyltransferase [Azospirillum sp.]HYD66548.1 glycosyltransferase [Azospirillum sp.]
MESVLDLAKSREHPICVRVIFPDFAKELSGSIEIEGDHQELFIEILARGIVLGKAECKAVEPRGDGTGGEPSFNALFQVPAWALPLKADDIVIGLPKSNAGTGNIRSVTVKPTDSDAASGLPRPVPAGEASDPPRPASSRKRARKKTSLSKGARKIPGQLDGFSSTGAISGWAFSDLAPVTVDIRVDGSPVLTVIADTFRRDLEEAGYGNGRCSFEAYLPARFCDGREHEISIACSEAAVSIGPALRVCIPPLRFAVDTVTGTGLIMGWICANATDTPYSLILTIDGDHREEVTSRHIRPDLAAIGLPSGSHGFTAQAPERFLDDLPHRVELTAENGEDRVALLDREIVLHHPVRLLGWPYRGGAGKAFPRSMPDGRPWPRISIVTPSFNQGAFIEETILSVLRQDYPSYEHIVIDGGSTDDTLKVLDAYRDRLAHLVSEPDKGQSNAINKGFRLATGTILTWLNSDDMLAPGALYAAALAFAEGDADMIAGICQVQRGGVIRHEHLTACDNGVLPIDDLLDMENCWLKGQFFYQPEVMFTRELFEKAGGYIDETLYYSMDYDLWVRFAAQKARLRVVGRPIAIFREHGQQKTACSSYKGELQEWAEALRRTYERPPPRPVLRTANAPLRLAFFNDVAFNGGAGIAHRRLAEACRLAGHEVLPVAMNDRTYSRIAFAEAASCVETIANFAPDLIVVGNIHCAQPDSAILWPLTSIAPILAVMHDQWWITGRCAYTKRCAAFVEGCKDDCSTPTEYPPLTPSKIAAAWRQKRDFFALPNVHAGSGSLWLAEFAARHLSPSRPAWTEDFCFGYGLDTQAFMPGDRVWLRRRLGLPEHAFIVLMAAYAFSDERKGMKYLHEALDIVGRHRVQIVCVGYQHAVPPALLAELEGKVIFTGILQEDRMPDYLAAADLLVGPSLEEAFGQVFIEAAACGTPAIAFRTGGVPQAIEDGVTGILVDTIDAAALAASINRALRDQDLQQTVATVGRLRIEAHFSLEALYHRFYHFLERRGILKEPLPRKISFDRAAPPLPAPVMPDIDHQRWRPVGGIHERLAPAHSSILPPIYWWLSEEGKIEFASPPPGKRTVRLVLRNWLADQVLTVSQDGREIGRFSVPVAHEHAPTSEAVLEFQCAGSRLTLRASRWALEGENRLSILLLKMLLS